MFCTFPQIFESCWCFSLVVNCKFSICPFCCRKTFYLPGPSIKDKNKYKSFCVYIVVSSVQSDWAIWIYWLRETKARFSPLLFRFHCRREWRVSETLSKACDRCSVVLKVEARLQKWTKGNLSTITVINEAIPHNLSGN